MRAATFYSQGTLLARPYRNVRLPGLLAYIIVPHEHLAFKLPAPELKLEDDLAAWTTKLYPITDIREKVVPSVSVVRNPKDYFVRPRLNAVFLLDYDGIGNLIMYDTRPFVSKEFEGKDTRILRRVIGGLDKNPRPFQRFCNFYSLWGLCSPDWSYDNCRNAFVAWYQALTNGLDMTVVLMGDSTLAWKKIDLNDDVCRIDDAWTISRARLSGPLPPLLGEILLNMAAPLAMTEKQLDVLMDFARQLLAGKTVAALREHRFLTEGNAIDWSKPKFRLVWSSCRKQLSIPITAHLGFDQRVKELLGTGLQWPPSAEKWWIKRKKDSHGRTKLDLPQGLPHVMYPVEMGISMWRYAEPGINILRFRDQCHWWSHRMTAAVMRALLEVHKKGEGRMTDFRVNEERVVYTQGGIKIVAAPQEDVCASTHSSDDTWECQQVALHAICARLMDGNMDADERGAAFLAMLKDHKFTTVDEALRDPFVADIRRGTDKAFRIIDDYESPTPCANPPKRSLSLLTQNLDPEPRLPLATIVYALLEVSQGRPVPSLGDLNVDKHNTLIRDAYRETTEDWRLGLRNLYSAVCSNLSIDESKRSLTSLLASELSPQEMLASPELRVISYTWRDATTPRVSAALGAANLITTGMPDTPFYDGRTPYTTLREHLAVKGLFTLSGMRDIITTVVEAHKRSSQANRGFAAKVDLDSIFICQDELNRKVLKCAYVYEEVNTCLCKRRRYECWACLRWALRKLLFYTDLRTVPPTSYRGFFNGMCGRFDTFESIMNHEFMRTPVQFSNSSL